VATRSFCGRVCHSFIEAAPECAIAGKDGEANTLYWIAFLPQPIAAIAAHFVGGALKARRPRPGVSRL